MTSVIISTLAVKFSNGIFPSCRILSTYPYSPATSSQFPRNQPTTNVSNPWNLLRPPPRCQKTHPDSRMRLFRYTTAIPAWTTKPITMTGYAKENLIVATSVTMPAVTVTTVTCNLCSSGNNPPSAVILERHCPSMQSMATGNRFGDLFGLVRWLRQEIPEGDYFVATLTRGRNISFEDDG